jgi:CRP/FNR family transcriptional regulator
LTQLQLLASHASRPIKLDGTAPAYQGAAVTHGPAGRISGYASGGPLAAMIAGMAISCRSVKPRDHLFHAGSSFRFFYLLTSGFAKCRQVSVDGHERTTALCLRGDLLGLDALASGIHDCDVVAIDECQVQAISYPCLLANEQRYPDLVGELYRAFSAEIRANRCLMQSIRCLPAEGRVATFLLDMSERFSSRGFCPTALQLRLSRNEIGGLLGLQLETVSRAFSRFARMGLIAIRAHETILLSPQGLQDVIAQPMAPDARIRLRKVQGRVSSPPRARISQALDAYRTAGAG